MTKKQKKARASAQGNPVLVAAVRSGAGPHRPKRERRANNRRWLRDAW